MVNIAAVSLDMNNNNFFNQSFRKKADKHKIVFESDDNIDVYQVFRKNNFVFFALDYNDKSYLARYDLSSSNFDAVFEHDFPIYSVIMNDSKVLIYTEDNILFVLDSSLDELMKLKTYKVPVGFEGNEFVVILTNSGPGFVYEVIKIEEISSITEGFPFKLLLPPYFYENRIAFQSDLCTVTIIDRNNNERKFKNSILIDGFIVTKKKYYKEITNICDFTKYRIDSNFIVSCINKLDTGLEIYGFMCDKSKKELVYTLTSSLIEKKEHEESKEMEYYDGNIMIKGFRNNDTCTFKSYIELINDKGGF